MQSSLVPGLVLCPAHMHLPAKNSLVNEVEFLGLIPKMRDSEIGNYYAALPLPQ